MRARSDPSMYRDDEFMNAWPDRDEMLGEWKAVFRNSVTNPGDSLESEADFSKPRVVDQATKRRKS